MVMDTSDAEVSDMSDEDGGGQPTRRARPNGIKRSVRCDLYGILQGDSCGKGLGYVQGVGGVGGGLRGPAARRSGCGPCRRCW